GVFYNGNPMAASDLKNRPHFRGLAVEVHWNDRSRALADGRLELGGIHSQRVGLDVHEHRPGARIFDCGDGGDEGEGYGDDLVPGTHPESEKREMEGARTSVDSYRMLDAAVGSELLFECLHLRTQYELARLEDTPGGLDDLRFYGP